MPSLVRILQLRKQCQPVPRATGTKGLVQGPNGEIILLSTGFEFLITGTALKPTELYTGSPRDHNGKTGDWNQDPIYTKHVLSPHPIRN